MKTIICILIVCLSIPSLLFSAEPSLTQRRQFQNIDALIALIEKARDAGISDDEIKKLQLNLKDKDVDVLEYIEAFRRRKRLADQKNKDFLATRFLTVSDIFNELVDMEPDRLENLREELISGD